MNHSLAEIREREHYMSDNTVPWEARGTGVRRTTDKANENYLFLASVLLIRELTATCQLVITDK